MVRYLWLVLLLSSWVYGKDKELIMEKATFAGGCFWCMESPFESLEGVQSVTSGYAGGTKDNPTYEEVTKGTTGHVESVQIIYNPQKISYTQLLNVYWRNIKPTQENGQFNDEGSQYRTVIFYHNLQQKKWAEKSEKDLENSKIFDEPIVTQIEPMTTFFPAEEYHQDYYKKNPLRYKFYRSRSGRDRFIRETWAQSVTSQRGQCSKTTKLDDHHSSPNQCQSEEFKQDGPSQNEVKEEKNDKKNKTQSSTQDNSSQLKSQLTPMQFQVTQKDGTEPAFKNAYWNHYEKGIYVDIVSGEPLFSSLDKFDSGTGWPSFIRPIDSKNIQTKEDHKLLRKRIEVRSKTGNSHLGHVFSDGPPSTELRYCINSAALRFVPAHQLAKQGYGKFTDLFK